MTIIAAMWESDDSILIGAESGQTEMPIGLRSQYTEKLQRHPTAPLAWGTAGNPTLGIHKFGKWLKQYNSPPRNLNRFEKELTRKVAEINGEQREVLELARAEEDSDQLFEVLIVGWLDKQPLILAIDDKGVSSIVDKKTAPFHAIGNGGVHAKLIHFGCAELPLLGIHVNTPSEAKLFHAILSVAAVRAPQCDPPINIFRVTPHGVSELDADELK